MSQQQCHFLFFICTTKERLKKAHFLYELLNHKCPSTTLYIVLPNPTLREAFQIDQHTIQLQCSDYYEDHSKLTLALFRLVLEQFPQATGVFKCCDQILPNMTVMAKFIKNIMAFHRKKTPIHYSGVLAKTHDNKNYRYNQHFGLCYDLKKNSTFIQLPRNVVYACSPLYYLSRESVQLFTNRCTEIMYEDVMVANHLAIYGIQPTSMQFFSRNIENIIFTNVLNPLNTDQQPPTETYKTLYIMLHGSLGERMFQTSAAYGLAKKKKMYLVFVNEMNYDVFHRIFLKEFPCIDSDIINELLTEAYPIIEKENTGYVYKENLIPEAVFATNRDVFMHGYFKNKRYFEHCTLDIFALFNTPLQVSKKIFEKQGLSSHFKNVRRHNSDSNLSVYSLGSGGGRGESGSIHSYLNASSVITETETKTSSFDKSFFLYISETQNNEFLAKAITRIREFVPNAYFYVLSHFDDEETLTNFDAIRSVDKTIITIRQTLGETGAGSECSSQKSGCSEITTQSSAVSDNNLIDALSIMSLCRRGGITSLKDPISWWGAFLNDNAHKIVIHEMDNEEDFTYNGVLIKESIFSKFKI